MKSEIETLASPALVPDRREIEFVLFELLAIERELLGRPPYDGVSRRDVDALLDRAERHAAALGSAFAAGEQDPARRIDARTVHVPAAFVPLWTEHVRDWFWLRLQADFSIDRRFPDARVPHALVQVTMEMFFGANPAFMPYSGFTPTACSLIRERGTPGQQARFLDALGSGRWDACLCATEQQAGSDLTAVQTRAEHVDGEVYRICGEKILITAGMHPLTENTLYLVLGRIGDGRDSPLSLSCFLVPRHWQDDDGTMHDNGVRCEEVHDKMGLRGCANTRLRFGDGAGTRGLLLGNQPNLALVQLHWLMARARIETGVFASWVASSAYRRAVRHAANRVQGAPFEKSANPWAAKVEIIRHGDVQRMLLDMKARSEGCRMIVARVSGWLSRLQQIHWHDAPEATDREEAGRLARLVGLFGPVIKGYISEEAWVVVTQAIQVHASVGYLRDCPLEQYARDVKVTTIWEGTTYIQAQDLVRDKLAFGRKRNVYAEFESLVRAVIARADGHPELAPERERIAAALDALGHALALLGTMAERGRLARVSQFATRFLTAFGDVATAWNLLDAACLASRRLAAADAGGDDAAFYRAKLKTVRYFVFNVLPRLHTLVDTLESAEFSHVDLDIDEFSIPA